MNTPNLFAWIIPALLVLLVCYASNPPPGIGQLAGLYAFAWFAWRYARKLVILLFIIYFLLMF